MPDFLIGLDLGQASDPTALSVVKRSLVVDAGGLPVRDHRDQTVYRFVCPHMKRFTLGTSYPDVVKAVARLVSDPRLQPEPWLAIDATGVGRAVVDLFLNERMPAQIVPITITAGDTVKRERWNRSAHHAYWVPKVELVSAVQAALQSRRLKIVPSVPEAAALKKELMDFRVTVTQAAHESFGALQGAHDDLVLSIAMPLWLAARREIAFRDAARDQFTANAGGEPDQDALAREAERERRALAKADAIAQANSERDWHSVDNEAFWDGRSPSGG